MPTIPELGQPLSARESDVLAAFCDDCHSAKEVARKLGISHRTVERHVENAIVKMGVRSQQHAVLTWDRTVNRADANALAASPSEGSAGDAPTKGITAPGCDYLALPDRLCNKCGRVHVAASPAGTAVPGMKQEKN